MGPVDLALDVAGRGALPELSSLAGGPSLVVTLADFAGAREYGVWFSSGDGDRALDVLAEIGPLIESGRFAHRTGEDGQVRGKLVLVGG